MTLVFYVIIKRMDEKKTEREDKRRQWRVFQLAHFIRDNNYPNVPKMMKYFELSRATINRDLDFLRNEYQMPIEYSQEHHGYYFTDPAFEIQSVMLSEGELLSVSTILPRMEQYKNTPLEVTFRSLMNKLIEMMPDKVTIDSSFLDPNVKFFSDPLPVIEDKVFNSIFEAVRKNKTIEFSYRSISRQDYTPRSFDPYKVLCQKGNWYVIGWCHFHNRFNVYSLSRMKALTITNDDFSVKPDFNLSEHIDPDFGIWQNNMEPKKIELLFSADINTYILERTWHVNQECHQNEDGSVYLSFMSNQIQETLHWVMSFGSNVKVLNPPELSAQIKAESKKLLDLYN